MSESLTENPGAIFRMYARDLVASQAVLRAGLDEAGCRIDALAADRDALAADLEAKREEVAILTGSIHHWSEIAHRQAADLETTKRALQRIAEEGECSINMDGYCVGAIHQRRIRGSHPAEYREVVGCGKHFAASVVAEENERT